MAASGLIGIEVEHGGRGRRGRLVEDRLSPEERHQLGRLASRGGDRRLEAIPTGVPHDERRRVVGGEPEDAYDLDLVRERAGAGRERIRAPVVRRRPGAIRDVDVEPYRPRLAVPGTKNAVSLDQLPHRVVTRSGPGRVQRDT